MPQSRVDCYDSSHIHSDVLDAITELVGDNLNIEVFSPSTNYPAHYDKGEESFFIAMEEGYFTTDNVHYPIVPFVLYKFDESIFHNSNFMSIMISRK